METIAPVVLENATLSFQQESVYAVDASDLDCRRV